MDTNEIVLVLFVSMGFKILSDFSTVALREFHRDGDSTRISREKTYTRDTCRKDATPEPSGR